MTTSLTNSNASDWFVEFSSEVVHPGAGIISWHGTHQHWSGSTDLILTDVGQVQLFCRNVGKLSTQHLGKGIGLMSFSCLWESLKSLYMRIITHMIRQSLFSFWIVNSDHSYCNSNSPDLWLQNKTHNWRHLTFSTNILPMAVSLSGLSAWITNRPLTARLTGVADLSSTHRVGISCSGLAHSSQDENSAFAEHSLMMFLKVSNIMVQIYVDLVGNLKSSIAPTVSHCLISWWCSFWYSHGSFSITYITAKLLMIKSLLHWGWWYVLVKLSR